MTGILLGDDMNNTLKKLQSDSPSERESATQAVLHLSAEDVKPILNELVPLAEKLLANEDKKGSAKTVILLIGKLKINDAIPFLVEHISFQAFYKNVKRLQPPEDRFPCVQALVDIGKGSLEPVVTMSKGTDDKVRLKCAAIVIAKILEAKDADTFVDGHLKGIGGAEKERLLQLKEYINVHNSQNMR